MFEKINLTMLTDYYEITMANGYLESGMQDEIAYFDLYFRRIPDGGGYAIMAGLKQVIDYLNNMEFTEEDIEYLRGKNCFDEKFLDFLLSANKRFTTSINNKSYIGKAFVYKSIYTVEVSPNSI